jgi:hypothetical protein
MPPCAHTSTDVCSGVTFLQAAFRTRTGSSRSASRYSTQNGKSIGPSPGLPRGGGIAERCDGVLPKYTSAGVAPPRPWCARPARMPGYGAGIKTPRPRRERCRMAAVSLSRSPRQFPLRPYKRPVVPDHWALSLPSRPLGCPSAAPEDIHGAVGAPFLHSQRSLVPEARALSHYSGDAS